MVNQVNEAMSFRTRWGRIGVLVAMLCVVAAAFVFGPRLFSGPDDGIQNDKLYRLAATYRARIEYAPGKTLPGRVFDFADRNLPRTSILVPVRDDRGVELVKINPGLPAGMLRKVIVQVPERIVEGVRYPAYTYPQWEYSPNVLEIQHVEPPVIPRR